MRAPAVVVLLLAARGGGAHVARHGENGGAPGNAADTTWNDIG